MAANEGVSEKFRARQIRVLPGTPLAVERLREKLLEVHGQLGFDALRTTLADMDINSDGVLSKDELQQGLKSMGIALSKADTEQALSYFDRNGDGVINLSEFVGGLQGDLR